MIDDLDEPWLSKCVEFRIAKVSLAMLAACYWFCFARVSRIPPYQEQASRGETSPSSDGFALLHIACELQWK